jgi:hypothetical protein
MDSEERLNLRESLGLYHRIYPKEVVVECAVMATTFEERQLRRILEGRGVACKRHSMDGIHDGVYLRIGRIGGTRERTVALDIRFCKINERFVCFFVPSGRFADYDMIKQWVQDVVLSAPDGKIRFSETADELIGLLLSLEIIPRLPH